jgi:hypothetical protein
MKNIPLEHFYKGTAEELISDMGTEIQEQFCITSKGRLSGRDHFP